MSDANNPAAWPVLDVRERRLLGVLVEKAKTTPDVYPMSVNALTVGANQKSNRDPVMNLSEEEVEETLDVLQRKGFVTRVQGGRVERWRHNLYDLCTSAKVEMAVITELLLRGPQTEGELRGRASRMEPIEDLETLRNLLRPLAERGLVVFLGPEGRRGTLITHGFCGPAELETLRSRSAAEEVMARPMPVNPAAENQATEIAELRSQLQELRKSHDALAEEFRTFKKSLGG